jgi:hypothetical protein
MKGVSAVVWCPDRTSWEDTYTDPAAASALRAAVQERLNKGGWRVAAEFPPLLVFTRGH